MVTGNRLRVARLARRWTQTELAGRAGLGRSTVANLEAGRHAIVGSTLTTLVELLPELADNGEARHRHAGFVSGGPFELIELAMAYVFGHHRCPAEIIEHRTVKALVSGADRYGLSLDKDTGEGFRIEQQAVLGGDVTQLSYGDGGGVSWNSCTFVFDRPLQRGETHTFAVRSLVDDDPDPTPETTIQVSFTIPTRMLRLELRFTGPEQPTRVRRFGPIVSTSAEDQWRAGTDTSPISRNRWVMLQIDPVPHHQYGLTWRW